MVGPPFRCTSMSYFLQVLLKLSLSPWWYGTVILRPIVSSIGSVTYETAKELSRIIKPQVGRSPHHVRNNQDFIHSLEEIIVEPEECMMSFDVKAL